MEAFLWLVAATVLTLILVASMTVHQIIGPVVVSAFVLLIGVGLTARPLNKFGLGRARGILLAFLGGFFLLPFAYNASLSPEERIALRARADQREADRSAERSRTDAARRQEAVDRRRADADRNEALDRERETQRLEQIQEGHRAYVALVAAARDQVSDSTLESITVAGPVAAARDFVNWAELYEQGRVMELNQGEEALRQDYRTLLLRRQAQLMPSLRAAYGAAADRGVWRENGDVLVAGTGNRRITFVGALFASNANVEDAHQLVLGTLRMLRFREAQYRWIPRGGQHLSYQIEHDPTNGAGNDTDLMVRQFPDGDVDSYNRLRIVNETPATVEEIRLDHERMRF